jgi:agmatine deiminase
VARTLTSTPRADGFRMPAEWGRHAATWLLWPQRPDVWRLGGKPAQRAFTELAAAISRFEPVAVGVNHDQFENARRLLPERVRVLEVSSNDAWMRDSGPTFVVDDRGEVRLVDWRFNAHGFSLPAWDKDDMVAGKIAEIEAVDRYRAPLVLEGGSIHVDGEGTVLTTRECLLNLNRNPGLSQERIDAYLKEYLGAEVVIWLDRGLDPDVTSGHVDDVAMFVRPGVVALAWTDDPHDWRREILAENLEILRSTRDARGRTLEVSTVPLPAEVVVSEEEASTIDRVEGSLPLPAGFKQAASYINCVLCNGGLIIPTFDDPADVEAAAVLQGLFPGRRLIALPGREVVIAGGCFHCITQQQPAGLERR